MNWQAEPALREAARIVQRLGAKTCAERAGRILDWLGLERGGALRTLAALVRGVPHQGGQAARAERSSSPRR